MSSDTLSSLVGRVQKRVGTLPDIFLVEDWLTAAYRDVMNRIPWTWRRKQGQALFYAPYEVGTVTVTRGSNVATFAGGATITSVMVGLQIRIGGNDTPIRTIAAITSSTVAQLDAPWGYVDQTAQTYSIYAAYATVPTDFESFLSIVDLQRNFQLDFWNYCAADLDALDPKRTYGGNVAYRVVLRDYTSNNLGPVGSVVAAHGTGNKPLSGGIYTGTLDATFVVEMTNATTFQWRKDNGAYTTGVAINAGGAAQTLSDGVTVTFPNSVVYTSGDVFAIPCSSAYSAGIPRYEFWPHIKTDEVRPFLYIAKMPDLTDAGAGLPGYLRGDVLVEMALAACARWPGTEKRQNPYFNVKLGMYHDGRVESMLADLEREDQARETTDLVYDSWTNLPTFDSAYLAGHDAGYELNVLDDF